MTLVVLALLTALVLAVIFGGRTSTFGRPTVRRRGLLGIVIVAWATSSAAKSIGVSVGWLTVAALTLAWFAVLNRGRPGVGLAFAGICLNALVMIVNAGIPVSLQAIERAGVPLSRVPVDSEAWTDSRPWSDPLREELTDHTTLPWLGEVVPLALPIRPSVASLGDVLIAAGGALFIFTGLTGIGRTVPERMLLPKEKKEKRKAKKAAKLAEAEAPAAAPIEAGVADSPLHVEAERPGQLVSGSSAVDPSHARATVPDSPDERAGNESVAVPIDPAIAAAKAAAEAAAAARKEAKRQFKKKKKQERKQQDAVAALSAAAAQADVVASEEPAASPASPSVDAGIEPTDAPTEPKPPTEKPSEVPTEPSTEVPTEAEALIETSAGPSRAR